MIFCVVSRFLFWFAFELVRGGVKVPSSLGRSDYTWVDALSIQRLVQGILKGYFRGCSRLFRGDSGRFLEEK